jgi:AcrR family transcriptional regulator
MDGSASAPRKRDAERTRQEILDAAAGEFAAHGLSGARVDAIAAKTQTTKRMIYYYFGSKEGLYEEVLSRAYGGLRAMENQIALESLDPVSALGEIVKFTFDYHDMHPEFIRLVMIENIHNGAYIATAPELRSRNRPAIEALERIIRAGHAAGVFARLADPIDLHLLISSMCFYRVSNRYTFGANFDCDLTDPAIRARQRRMIVDTVLSYMKG